MHAGTPDGQVFRNTCFIASVLQLRDVIPQVEQQLQLSTSVRENVVKLVCSDSFVNGQYKYDLGFDGQHDAAELLGIYYGIHLFVSGD